MNVKIETNVSKIDSSPIKVDRKLFFKMLVGLAALLGIAYICGSLFREPIVAAGAAAMKSWGMIGLFLGVIATDASPLPLTNEPLVILSISGGVSTRTVFLVVSAASVTAGIVGYTGGFLVGSRTPLGVWIKRRYPGFESFMNRYGAIGVAICAFLPIPFALSTWSAGMTRIGLCKVALASLVRVPKTAFYLWLIVTGWAMGVNSELDHLPDNVQHDYRNVQRATDSTFEKVIDLNVADRKISLPTRGQEQE